MPTDAMIAFSAACVAISASGVVYALRHTGAAAIRFRFIAVLGLLSGLAGLPLIAAFAPGIYGLYLPLTLPVLLALSPAVYLFIDGRTRMTHAPTPDWRHGILPAAGLIVTIGFWSLPASVRSAMFIDGDTTDSFGAGMLAFAAFALILIWSFISFFYLLAALKRLKAFRARLKDFHSNVDNLELRWIDWFTGFLVVLWTASASALIGDNIGPGLVVSGEVVLALTASLLLFLVAFSMTTQAGSDDPAKIESLSSSRATPASAEKYARSALSVERATRLAGRIETAMRDDQIYLDATLSLDGLARHLRAAPNHISQTLNQQLETSFFDFIARWRIAAAKPMLLDDQNTILSVAYGVGFNSRSTFYKAFKRETGMTPAAFRAAEMDDNARSQDPLLK
jgi:AraC-like DNA-binding protein